MRKLVTSPPDLDHFSGRPTRRAIHLLFALCIGLLMTPLAYEVGAVCATNWKAMSGRIDHVETPILDTLSSAWRGTVGTFRHKLNGSYRLSMPWRPSMIIALGFGWAVFMSVPLRRSH